MIASVYLPVPGKFGLGVPREHWPLMRCRCCGVIVKRHPRSRRCLKHSCYGELEVVDRDHER